MALIFLGRVGIEHYSEKVGDKVENKTRPQQQFSSGRMIFREKKIEKRMFREPVLGPDQKPMKDESGNDLIKEVQKDVLATLAHSFDPNDIGKPYDKFVNEAEILAKYPEAFKKA